MDRKTSSISKTGLLVLTNVGYKISIRLMSVIKSKRLFILVKNQIKTVVENVIQMTVIIWEIRKIVVPAAINRNKASRLRNKVHQPHTRTKGNEQVFGSVNNVNGAFDVTNPDIGTNRKFENVGNR